ncbi:MAG: preprotein translocase subunit SecA [Patescibacteria group bacterium]
MEFLSKIFGDGTTKKLKTLEPLVAQINTYEHKMSALSDDALKAKTQEFRKRLRSEEGPAETLDDILPEAFAVVRETAKRVLKQRHYDVQLMGGIILHQGNISEMKTGEGKTLVATLPTYLNALEGLGVHVVTVNDYLSRRDTVWMGQLYTALGLSIAVINHDSSYIYDPTHKELDEKRDQLGSFKVFHQFLRPCTRREAYEADITYGTNNEFGFDYLRDNVVYTKSALVQREHNYAIVDEIDSILIDEARTPLIISAPAQESEDLYRTFSRIAMHLKKDEDYAVDEKLKAIQLTDSGIEKAEHALGVENIYTEKGIKYVHHLETAVRAQALFERDKDYVVRDDEVIIVDEFTGRLQPGRRWSEGLHQAIEAKEGVQVQRESRTVASITFQNYFRFYKKLSGMTGTALTSHEEFYKVYGLEVIPVPTNQRVARIDGNDLIFQTEQGKFKAVAKKIKELHDTGQPVLVGTVSIEKNELLSAYLNKEGIPHKVLNAKQHESEGEVIAQGGRKGSVVVATNMAGRGVDIKLGGNPASQEEYEEVKRLGGLFVLGTERHEARRIDNQLRGRAGRQGDPGGTQFFVSLEDTLMRVFASDAIKTMMGRFGIPEDQPIENKMISRALENAQTKIEGFNFDARKHVLAYDDVMNQQRKTVYERRGKLLRGDGAYAREFLDEITEGREDLKKLIEEKKQTLGEEVFWDGVRKLALQTMDMLWMEHLEAMDYMRSSVNLRAYGQRDPLVEYKREGLRLFRDMQDSVKSHFMELLPNIGAGAFAHEEQKLKEVHENARLIGDVARPTDSASAGTIKREGEKVGRNDPCPCGAKRPDGTPVKYKNCHGK